MSKRQRESKDETKVEYFDFDKFPTGVHDLYVRLKHPNSAQYGHALYARTTIEILWPDNSLSQHKIDIETEEESFYCSDAYTTFFSTYHYPFISVDYHGTSLGKVKLTSIDGIKIRIVGDN